MSTIYEEMQMLDEQLETELLEDDVGLDNWEFEDSEDDELEEENLDKTDDSEESELTPEEEEIIVELLSMLNDSLDKVLSNAIQKLLELNKTQEIQMRSEVVELESGETYLLQLAFLPSEINSEKGWWIPVDVDLIFGKPKRKRRYRALPKFWQYIQKNQDTATRRRIKERIDYSLQCPMNFLVDVWDEWEKPYKRKRAGGVPTENFLVNVKGGRADSHQTQKVRAYAERIDKAIKKYHIEKLKQNDKDDNSAYISLCEELEEATEELKKSIRKMNQKTMSQMIRLAMGCDKSVGITAEVRGTYSKYGNKILKILYDYDRDLFLSCFKKGEQLNESDINKDK